MEPFTCRSCARVFLIAPARDRHQLRCRAQPRSRKKACEECSRSKTRCDGDLPACHRCSTLSRLCIYPLNVPVNHAAQQQVVLGPPVTASADLENWTGQFSHDSSVAAVPGWDTQQVMAYTSNIAPVLLTPESQSHDMQDQPRPKSPSSQVIGHCAQFPTGPTPDAFDNLSHILTRRWRTTQEGLNMIEHQLKCWPECLVNQMSNPPFIHWRHCCASQRSEVLATVVVIVPLYLSPTAQSHSIVKASIASQMKDIYLKAVKYPPSESLAAFQATILYTIMRTIHDSTTSVPMIDEQAVRISQGFVADTAKHVLAKNIHCIDPDTNVQLGSWDHWIMDESIRRTFVALEALDMLCRARNNLPPVFCAYFCESILPCPENIWQASTAEDWLSRYGTWETYCGRPLRMRDIIQWIRGEISGKEEQLTTWFETVGELGEVIFVCARAYVVAAGLDGSV